MEKESVDWKVSIVFFETACYVCELQCEGKNQHPCAIPDEAMVIALGWEEKVSEHYQYSS